MKIVYVSTLVSQKKLDYIISNAKIKPLQSIQKFSRLMCEGFTLNDCSVDVISSVPMSRKIMKKVFWFEKRETEGKINYKYIPFMNFRFVRQFMLAFNLIFILFRYLFDKEEKVFVCDILNTTISSLTLLFSKIFRIPCISIVTDLPRDINSKSLSSKINQFFESKYDGYIFLTEPMNEVINKKDKPYIVVECIVDNVKDDSEYKKKDKYTLLYAGGLYEAYGIKNLIDAVLLIDDIDVSLDLYGFGDMEDYIKSLNNKNIKYYGVKPNKDIVISEKCATLLVNPRFSAGDYTKYSFPSKIMEYMLSGTPVLTTKLSGIPLEYHNYLYFIDDESVLGMKKAIQNVLSIKPDILSKKGCEAQQFVLVNKNKVVQAKKIKEFIGSNYNIK